jgi:hypothetical protein
VDCSNTYDFFPELATARKTVMDRNPKAFVVNSVSVASKQQPQQPLLQQQQPLLQQQQPSQSRSATTKNSGGCKCRRSQCLKKYCDCFGASAYCGPHCKCVNCKNQILPGQLYRKPRVSLVVVEPPPTTTTSGSSTMKLRLQYEADYARVQLDEQRRSMSNARLNYHAPSQASKMQVLAQPGRSNSSNAKNMELIAALAMTQLVRPETSSCASNNNKNNLNDKTTTAIADETSTLSTLSSEQMDDDCGGTISHDTINTTVSLQSDTTVDKTTIAQETILAHEKASVHPATNEQSTTNIRRVSDPYVQQPQYVQPEMFCYDARGPRRISDQNAPINHHFLEQHQSYYLQDGQHVSDHYGAGDKRRTDTVSATTAPKKQRSSEDDDEVRAFATGSSMSIESRNPSPVAKTPCLLAPKEQTRSYRTQRLPSYTTMLPRPPHPSYYQNHMHQQQHQPSMYNSGNYGYHPHYPSGPPMPIPSSPRHPKHPPYETAQQLSTASVGLPRCLSFRKICSRCGKTRAEHGDQHGFGHTCDFSDCGKCGCTAHVHDQHGETMGVLCRLTKEMGACPRAMAAYEATIQRLVRNVAAAETNSQQPFEEAVTQEESGDL